MVHHPLQSENDRCIWTGDGNAQSKLVLSVIFGHYVQKHNIFWRDFRVIISKIMCILTIASCLEGTVWRFHSSDFAMFWNKHSLRVTASHLLSRSHIKGLLLLLVFCWSLTSHFFFSAELASLQNAPPICSTIFAPLQKVLPIFTSIFPPLQNTSCSG